MDNIEVVRHAVLEFYEEFGYGKTDKYRYISVKRTASQVCKRIEKAVDAEAFEDKYVISTLPVVRSIIADYIVRNTDFLDYNRAVANEIFTPERAEELVQKLTPLWCATHCCVIPDELKMLGAARMIHGLLKKGFVAVSRDYMGLDAERIKQYERLF